MLMKVENIIHIDAPKSTVWAITEDVEHWPDWLKTIESVTRIEEGPFKKGSAAMIKQLGLPEAKWIVTAMTYGEMFTWETRFPGITMVATHELKTTETGTLNLLRIEVSGIAALLLWLLIRFPLGWALGRENVSLKAKCEGFDLS